MSDVHVIVIGASLAGLAIAQGLQKKGISYVVAERETAPRDRNWGITVSAPPTSAHVCAQGTPSYLAQASSLACSISLPEKGDFLLAVFFDRNMLLSSYRFPGRTQFWQEYCLRSYMTGSMNASLILH
jgi:hypothetical protein